MQLGDERRRAPAAQATEWREQLLEQLGDDGDRLLSRLAPGRRESEAHGAVVGRVARPLDQARLFEGFGELRHVDRLQADVLGELALAGLPAAAVDDAVQRRQHRVLGVGEPEW